MSEANYLKPQSPLMRGADYVLPITTADQIVVGLGTENERRLEQNGQIVADVVRGISGEFITIAVLAANWVQQEDGRWTQTVAVEGITAETRGRYADVDLSNATPETFAAMEEAWLYVSMIETVDGGIMLTSFENAPAVDFNVNVEVLF